MPCLIPGTCLAGRGGAPGARYRSVKSCRLPDRVGVEGLDYPLTPGTVTPASSLSPCDVRFLDCSCLGETRSTCAAAAGTFLLEFGALSRLTRDPSFEAAARRAVTAVWSGRSPLGLVGGGLDGARGVWKSGHAGIGAGTDSFYEYLYKSARLLGDDEMGSMFLEAYRGVEKHLKWNGWHVEVDRVLGNKVCVFLVT